MSQIISGVIYTATVGTLKSMTVVRASPTIGSLTDNNMTIQFTSANAIKNGEKIYIKVPYD